MKLKIIILSVLLCPVFLQGFSQSFFKPLPKVKPKQMAYGSTLYPRLSAPGVVTVDKNGDSLQNAFRPIVNIAAYAEPGHILMAGAGLSYQHLRFTQASQKWYCEWSISAVGWAGGSVAPHTPTDAVSYGIMFGAFNNLLMVGPAINAGKVQAVVSIGISLNN